MDQKSWLWRKRLSEKTIVASMEEVQSQFIDEELDLEKSVKTLSEQLANVLDECLEKDGLLQKYEKMAEESVEGKNKAEAEVRRLKQELDGAKQEKATANERLAHLNSALKDSMNQLNFVREEHDKRINDAVIKTSDEFDKSHKKLEGKLAETSKKLADLTVESSYLGKALVVKERLIEDLSNSKSQTEAEFKALMTRLDSCEKENTFLRCEFRMIEKDLNNRNEELKYGRRSAEASQKQNLENVKKIKKLETDCQRLRAITRQRAPGPVAWANVNSFVEVERGNRVEMRRNGVNAGGFGAGDSRNERCNENMGRKLGLLIDQIKDLEKENNILKDCLSQKDEEIFLLKKANNSSEISSLTSAPESKMTGASDISLMDDFVEMEKLAIVAVDTPFTGSYVEKPNDWLKDVTKVIMKECGFSKRSLDEVFGDIRLTMYSPLHSESDMLLPISGYIDWKSPKSASAGTIFDESSCECLQSEINSAVRDEFKKQLGGEGPGTAFELESVQNLMHKMEKLHSDLRDEILGLKNEINLVKSSKNIEASPEPVQSEQDMGSSNCETDISKQKRTITGDPVENQKEMNEDLDTQLPVTRAKLNEAMQKLSSLEVELENKTHCCEELEGMCVELQLQLQSTTNNPKSDDKENQELLQTGLEITKASAKLAECEQTIMKLGLQLKELGSAKEMTIVDKVRSITEINNNKFKLRTSLRQILSEDSARLPHLQSPKTKEVISTTKSDRPSVFPASDAYSFPDSQDPPPIAYLGTRNEAKNSNEGALIIFPRKGRQGRLGFIRKLLVKRKNASCKNSTVNFGSR